MKPVGHLLKRISQVQHLALANILFQFDLPSLIFPLYIHYSLVKLPICMAYKLILCIHISVQFSSVTQSCPTLCNPMNHSTPGLPVHHQLPEFTQTHVHRVSDAIQPSHPLPSPSPAPNPSQHQSLSNESTLRMRWPKYWSSM